MLNKAVIPRKPGLLWLCLQTQSINQHAYYQASSLLLFPSFCHNVPPKAVPWLSNTEVGRDSIPQITRHILKLTYYSLLSFLSKPWEKPMVLPDLSDLWQQLYGSMFILQALGHPSQEGAVNNKFSFQLTEVSCFVAYTVLQNFLM